MTITRKELIPVFVVTLHSLGKMSFDFCYFNKYLLLYFSMIFKILALTQSMILVQDGHHSTKLLNYHHLLRVLNVYQMLHME